MTQASAEAQIDQYLTFVLGAETFALGILAIKEIIEYSSLTDVPMMPPYVRGVINLRGAAVPVIDLTVRFGRASAPVTKRTCIVIIEVMANEERQVIGIVVDAVNEVLDIPVSNIKPPPAVRRRHPGRLHPRHGQGPQQVRHLAGRESRPGIR